eukprot:gb/GECH01013540.1/.p1 GENE.gb/GECH01013540.1/~~gb/GECH01013540.1/.p1  ORF type:complete len:467 (+),score=112.98 gb/GECH01013540.1/:1-1401(+)
MSNDSLVTYRLEFYVHGIRPVHARLGHRDLGFLSLDPPPSDPSPRERRHRPLRHPMVAFRLADYPLVTLRPGRGERGLAFRSGKACVFRTDPGTLAAMLEDRRLHVMLFDASSSASAGPSHSPNPRVSWGEGSGRLMATAGVNLSPHDRHEHHHSCTACIHKKGGYSLINATGIEVGVLDADVSLVIDGGATITSPASAFSAAPHLYPLRHRHRHPPDPASTFTCPSYPSSSAPLLPAYHPPPLTESQDAANLHALTQTLQAYAASQESTKRQRAIFEDTLHRLANTMDLSITPRRKRRHHRHHHLPKHQSHHRPRSSRSEVQNRDPYAPYRETGDDTADNHGSLSRSRSRSQSDNRAGSIRSSEETKMGSGRKGYPGTGDDGEAEEEKEEDNTDTMTDDWKTKYSANEIDLQEQEEEVDDGEYEEDWENEDDGNGASIQQDWNNDEGNQPDVMNEEENGEDLPQI